MPSTSSSFNRALHLHREAAAHLAAARAEAAGVDPGVPSPRDGRRSELAERLNDLATDLARGWLGAPLTRAGAARKLGIDAVPGRPMYVRAGTCHAAPGADFPVVLPFLGAGHLVVDRDARDPAVAGWLRAMLLRATAALPEGAVRVLPVDGGTLGAVFAPFRTLAEAAGWPRPATDADAFRAVLDECAEQIAAAQTGADGELPYLLVVCGALPVGCGGAEFARLAALAHAGPAARVHLLLAGYPPAGPLGYDAAPRLDHTTYLTASRDGYTVGEPPGPDGFDPAGGGLAGLVTLDPAPADGLIETVCRPLAATARSRSAVDFAALLPAEIWTESSAGGLRTRVGRAGREWCELALDDVTPHWLVGGRTGSGKTVFLLDVLYGLASRYSPDELTLYLLDFKEGVSFAEFVPTDLDGSWIPHARTVGIESDREYGLAVLRELSAEMGRRANELKRAGVTRIIDLRAGRPDVAMPRVVVVIDEFHVLFAGNDPVARQAATALEELARKGRSYGIHLILASQTVSGVEALFTKGESIFGQFPMRVALAGGGGVLDAVNRRNNAADNLPVGTGVINPAAGAPEANRLVRFPMTEVAAVTAQRHKLWHNRTPGAAPPAVFAGYAEYRVRDAPEFARLRPDVRRRQALVGRVVDVGLPLASFTFDNSPGRHLAVLGPSPAGAGLLHAATVSLAKQHPPGDATFLLVPLVGVADAVADRTAEELLADGHRFETLDLAGLRAALARLAATTRAGTPAAPTYLVVFGADAASAGLAVADPATMRTGLDDLRAVLRGGPAVSTHVLGWWRGGRRFGEDIGGANALEDVACLVALNLPTNDLSALLGDYQVEWKARPNRALLIDRHEDRLLLTVPFA